MKKVNVSACKVGCRAAFALGCFVFLQLVGARDARAESPKKVEGFEALGTLGYAFGHVAWWGGKEVTPYGVTLGLDLGYTFPFGLRIGAQIGHGFGRTLEETSSTGEVVATDVSSAAWGGSVGYDLLLSFFRLRGAVDAGLITYYHDYHEGVLPPGASYYIGPEVALIWQYRAFELGLQTKYWATSEDGSGNGGVFHVALMSGARF